MPSGIEAFQRKQEHKERQKAASDAVRGSFTNDFRLRGGESATVRFLEQGPDLTFAETHRIPIQGKNGYYHKDFICLNTNDDATPCPACGSSNADISKRITRGFLNLIWRNAPVFQLDENQRMVKGPDKKPIIVSYEDQVALWKCSWTVFQTLLEKDGRYKGLMSRDWEIKRTGSSMQDTAYHVEPADPDAGPQPMLISDLSLAEKKYNVVELTTPLPYAAFAEIINRGAMPSGPQPTMDRSAALPSAANTFQEGPSVRASAFTRG